MHVARRAAYTAVRAVLALAVGGCGFISELDERVDVDDTASGMRFTRPAAWQRYEAREHDPATDGPLAYLSNVPLPADCATSPGQPRLRPFENGRA